jgi:dephospho-CoA kinase
LARSIPPRVHSRIADIPLLFEVGRDRRVRHAIVVAAIPKRRSRRVIARDGLTEAEARQRLAAQIPIDEKVRRATIVIWTNGTDGETGVTCATCTNSWWRSGPV